MLYNFSMRTYIVVGFCPPKHIYALGYHPSLQILTSSYSTVPKHWPVWLNINRQHPRPEVFNQRRSVIMDFMIETYNINKIEML